MVLKKLEQAKSCSNGAARVCLVGSDFKKNIDIFILFLSTVLLDEIE